MALTTKKELSDEEEIFFRMLVKYFKVTKEDADYVYQVVNSDMTIEEMKKRIENINTEIKQHVEFIKETAAAVAEMTMNGSKIDVTTMNTLKKMEKDIAEITKLLEILN